MSTEPRPFVLSPSMVERYRVRMSGVASRVWRLTDGIPSQVASPGMGDVYRLGNALDDLLDREAPTLREHCAAARIAHEGFVRSMSHASDFREFEVELGSIALDFFGRSVEDEKNPGPGPEPGDGSERVNPTPAPDVVPGWAWRLVSVLRRFAESGLRRQLADTGESVVTSEIRYLVGALQSIEEELGPMPVPALAMRDPRVDRIIEVLLTFAMAEVEVTRNLIGGDCGWGVDVSKPCRELQVALDDLRDNPPNPGHPSSMDGLAGLMMTRGESESPRPVDVSDSGSRSGPVILYLPKDSHLTIDVIKP